MKAILRSKEQGSTTINIYVQGVSDMTMLINSVKFDGGTLQLGDNCCSGNVNVNGEPVKVNIKPVKNIATTQCPMAGTCDRCDKCMYCNKKAQVGYAVPFLRACEQAGVKNNKYSLVPLEQYRAENIGNTNSTAQFILKVDEKSITRWHDVYISFKFNNSEYIWILDTRNGNMASVKKFENVPKIIDKDIASKKNKSIHSSFEPIRTTDKTGHSIKKFGTVANVTFKIERVVALLTDVQTGYVLNDYTKIAANVMDVSGGLNTVKKLQKYVCFSRFKHNNIEWSIDGSNSSHGSAMNTLVSNIVDIVEEKTHLDCDITTEQKTQITDEIPDIFVHFPTPKKVHLGSNEDAEKRLQKKLQITDAITNIILHFPKISVFDSETLNKITTLSSCGDWVELENWLRQNIPAL